MTDDAEVGTVVVQRGREDVAYRMTHIEEGTIMYRTDQEHVSKVVDYFEITGSLAAYPGIGEYGDLVLTRTGGETFLMDMWPMRNNPYGSAVHEALTIIMGLANLYQDSGYTGNSNANAVIDEITAFMQWLPPKDVQKCYDGEKPANKDVVYDWETAGDFVESTSVREIYQHSQKVKDLFTLNAGN